MVELFTMKKSFLRLNFILNQNMPDNLDGVGPGSVPGSHVSVALGDGTVDGEVTVLSVHVVGAWSRVVSQPDTKILKIFDL